MAILKISNTVLSGTKLLKVMETQFDKVVELVSDDPNIRRFSILGKKFNLPINDTEVAIEFACTEEPDGTYIIGIYKLPEKRPREYVYHISNDTPKNPITQSDLRLRYHMGTGKAHHKKHNDIDGIDYYQNHTFDPEYVMWLEQELIKLL